MIKTFTLKQDQEANAFIETVVEPQITITDNVIAVTYQSTKEGYGEYFRNFLIEATKRNLFNERVRLVALNAEIEEGKEHGTNFKDFDELLVKQKEANQNIRRFEAKVKALEAWQTSQS